VLSGEYVVLQGAPAIAAAVDRRVRVSVSESQSESHCITAPGYLKGKWFFHAGKDRVFVWQEALPETSAFSLVEEVWRSFDSAEWPALNLVIDTQQFCDPDTGQKLGLGSSAAVAVALSAALGKYASLNSNNGRTAMDAHDRFQDGRGSGVIAGPETVPAISIGPTDSTAGTCGAGRPRLPWTSSPGSTLTGMATPGGTA
jgi:phosphomevalonate kinase